MLAATVRSSLAALAVTLAVAAGACSSAPRPTNAPARLGLPLHAIPVGQGAAGSPPMVVLLTGDGGWAAFDAALAADLARAGIPVVGLDSRAYLKQPRTPGEMARDLGRILRWYLPEWNRDRVVLIGYSRGADIVPFALDRLPPDLRERVELLVLIGPARFASFHFQWRDLLSTASYGANQPVGPEIARLGALPILCLYGTRERQSLCRSLGGPHVQVVARPGGHAVPARAAPWIVAQVESALAGATRPSLSSEP